MSQVSYGTITITDTTDIERIYMVYAGSDSNTTPPNVNDFTLWKTDITQTSGTYIWQRAVVKKSGIEITAQNFQQFYGEPVCITGEGGRSIKSITTYYCNYGTGTPDENYNGWNINTPEYDEDKPNYWVKTVVIYVDDSETEFESSGSIASIEDGEHKQVTSFSVDLQPIQDLNGYDHPWAGGNGKNKLPYPYTNNSGTTNGITYSTSADGRVTISGTATATAWVRLYGGFATDTSLKKPVPSWITADTDYVLSGGQSSNFYVQANLYSGTSSIGQWIDTGGGKSFSLTSEQISSADSFAVFIRVNSGQTVNATITPMLEEGSTKTSWEPYSNICPISGRTEVVTQRTGKNLLPNTATDNTLNGIKYIVNADGSVTGNGTATGNANFTIFAGNFLKSGSYIGTAKGATNDLFGTISLTHSDGSVTTYIDMKSSADKPFTVAEGDRIHYYIHSQNGKVVNNITIYPMIRLASVSDATYEPYNGNTYTTALGRTVYGGTLDVVSGVLTVTHAIRTFDGTEGWRSPDSSTICWLRDDTLKKTSNYKGTIIASTMPTAMTRHQLHYDFECGISGYEASGADNYWYIKAPNQTTQTPPALKAWLQANNVQVCYELATPQTYQLTPQQVTLLLGENNLWSDSGDINASGFTIVNRDVQIHFDNGLTEAIANSVEANTNASDALDKANESNSIAIHANENAQGALSISRATQQHFWFNSTTSGSIEAGAYITDTPIDTFKSGKNGGYLLARSDGVELGRGTNKFMTLSATALNFYRPGTNTIDATLTSKGLVLSKGGIEAGTKNTTNYIYIYSDDDATNHKLTINSHEASDWRIVAGKNFGVDKAGNLYASGANIQGKITITSGSNVYTKTEADAAANTAIGNATVSSLSDGSAYSKTVEYSYSNNGRGSGYAKICNIAPVSGATYFNQPIRFDISTRNATKVTSVNIVYSNTNTATAATIALATYSGNVELYYLSKGSGSYDIYFKLGETYDEVKITNFYNPQPTKVTVTWAGAYHGTDVPSEAVKFKELSGGVDYSTITSSIGNKADKIAAVAEEQLIYISKASGTASVSGTTTWITEAGDKQNTWSTKRPTYNSSYPVLFVAKQKKVVSGTVTCTTPIKDDTTTIIDGGHITTGTIDSNRLNADTIKVNAANIQGSLTIGQLPSTVAETSDIPTKVSELTNDSGYQNSTQVSSAINEIRSWYATCSTAAGTAAKVATITPTTTAFTTSILTAGTLVNVKFTVTNTATVSDLTLNINNTGAKHIKTLRYGVISNIAGTGYLAKDTTYQFTYDGTYWVMQENYNVDTVNRTRWQNIIAAAEAITNGHIICGTASGYRNIAANVSFDMDYPLLYAGTTIAKGATTGTRDNNFLEINSINASSNGTITSGAANKVLFLKGTLTNNTFKIAASPFMTTVAPTSEDNFCYIPLGIMYSATNIYFRSSDQLYAYKDGAFGPVSIREASAASKTATTYITRIDDNGIKVHAKNNVNSNYAKINASGMEVYKGGDSVAFYGDTARIGKASSNHIDISSLGMSLYDSSLAPVMTINALGGHTTSKALKIIEQASGESENISIDISSDNNLVEIWEKINNGDEFTISISCLYLKQEGTYNHFTSKSISQIFNKGTTNTSNSYVKYTAPDTLTFTNTYPTAPFGYEFSRRTVTIEIVVHNIGPVYQFCNNPDTKTLGAYSFVTGNGTVTTDDYQTAVGTYNATTDMYAAQEEQGDYKAIFTVGRGESDFWRQNAMVVTHDENNGSTILIGLEPEVYDIDTDITSYIDILDWHCLVHGDDPT